MKYENAYKGVKLLFWSEIVTIACAVFSLTAAVTSAVVKDVAVGEATLYAIFAMIAAMVGVVAGIIGIFGYYKASADEKYFFYSLAFVLTSVILSVIAAFLTEGTRVRRVLELLTTLFEELTLIYAIYAIVQLAKKLDNAAIAKFGNFLLNLIFVILVLIIASDVIIIVTQGNAVVAAILAIVDALLSIVAYVLYLVYLAKAKNMLA